MISNTSNFEILLGDNNFNCVSVIDQKYNLSTSNIDPQKGRFRIFFDLELVAQYSIYYLNYNLFHFLI